MEKGGADIVEMTKESEEAPFLLVVPHLKQKTNTVIITEKPQALFQLNTYVQCMYMYIG